MTIPNHTEHPPAELELCKWCRHAPETYHFIDDRPNVSVRCGNTACPVRRAGWLDLTFWNTRSRAPVAAPVNDAAKTCGFCRMSEYEVKALIAAPVGFICDECVAICASIIERQIPAPSTKSAAARRAAEECESLITCLLAEDEKENTRHKFTAIISRHFAATDALVDEVQRRMDQVVEAAVEWHQAGREGTDWFDKAEALGAAIDSLLELRTPS